jgi:hypothetical protein
LSFLWLNETLICIDDLERKGTSLSLKDVLGLVSLLKEQKKCKIVLLLNDGEEGLEDYAKYREKVIDVELQFAPTAAECASIALDTNQPDMKLLAKFVQELDIRNIRIIKKIERLVKLVGHFLNDCEQDVVDRAFYSLAIFSLCHYCSGDNIPDLDYVTSTVISRKELQNDKHKRWDNFLYKHGYGGLDDFDLILANVVRSGYCIEDNIKKESTRKSQIIKSEKSFKKAWQLYYNSFDNNQIDVIMMLYKSFIDNVENVSRSDLNDTVVLFRNLEEYEKASEIIDIYIDKRKGNRKLFCLKHNNLYYDMKDAEKIARINDFNQAIDREIVDKFNIFHDSTSAIKTSLQILHEITIEEGYDEKDIHLLSNTSIEEYCKIFKSLEGIYLRGYIKSCLKFGQPNNSCLKRQKIYLNVVEALKKIAEESSINKQRMKTLFELDN